MAEFRALCAGLKLIVQYDISCSEFLIECDSMFLVKTVMGACSCPWSCLDYLRQIKALLKNLNFQLVHVFREANGVDDRLVLML